MMDGLDRIGNDTTEKGVRSASGPSAIVLAESAVPYILLSSATNISATGAITGATALPYTPTGVVFVYIFSQTGLTAGVYAARFSSTTACQLYSDAAGTVELSGITAGAYVGGITAAIVASIAIPARAMGPNGQLRINHQFVYPTTAGSKNFNVTFGSATVLNSNRTTAGGGDSFTSRVVNRGIEDRQLIAVPSESATSSNSLTRSNIDTTVAQSVIFTLQLITTQADYMILEGYTIEVVYGA